MPYYGDGWHRSRDLRVYYRGDPGLFSFLKKAVHAVAGVVGGVAKPLIAPAMTALLGPVGGLVPVIAGALGGGAGKSMPTGQPPAQVVGGTPGEWAGHSEAMARGRGRRRRRSTTRRRRRSY